MQKPWLVHRDYSLASALLKYILPDRWRILSESLYTNVKEEELTEYPFPPFFKSKVSIKLEINLLTGRGVVRWD